MNTDTIDLSRALIPHPGQERLVKGRFWQKVRRTLGRVPFLDRAVAAYFAATDRATPVHVKATIYAALAYFVVPVDAIPDVVAGLGFSDDGAVLLIALQTIAPYITDVHLERARAFLAKAEPAERRRFFRQG